MVFYYPKREFARRLLRLRNAIDRALSCPRPNDGDLFPALFSLLALIWCKDAYSLFKKRPNDLTKTF